MERSIKELKQYIVDSLGAEGIARLYQNYSNNQEFRLDTSEGWSHRVLCPIHNDQKTPNFFANLTTGSFKCMSCGAGGSIFDFWLIRNGYSKDDKSKFKDAIIALAAFANVSIGDWNKKPPGSHAYSYSPSTPLQEDVIPKGKRADINDASTPAISMKVVDGFHANLRADHIRYLLTKRGLKKKTIDKYKIGFDPEWIWKTPEADGGEWMSGRYTIPVFNKNGECRNIRGYAPLGQPAYKMANYVSNKSRDNEVKYGSPPRLFCLHELVTGAYNHIVVVEGEFDCILLNQMLHSEGYDNWLAVTSTHGNKTFEVDWVEYLHDKYIYICFDCDDEGKLAASNVATNVFLPLMKSGKFYSVKIINLPLSGTKDEKDITDYVMKAGFNAGEFIDLCNGTDDLIVSGYQGEEATVQAIEVDNFVDAVKNRAYIDKRIRVPITISGNTSRLYHAIKEYTVKDCKLMKQGNDCCCSEAGLQTIPYGHPLFIQSCMNKEYKNVQSIARMTCQKDETPKIHVNSKVVMEMYYAHQVVERWRAEEVDGKFVNAQELVAVPVYILQPPENLQIGPQNYMATGYVRTHPETSVATLFIEQLEPLEDDWKKFSIKNPEQKDKIRHLKEDFTTDEIIDSIVNGVTNIYDADEILYAVLLTFLSPLAFYFNNVIVNGWMNTAIIGDSGTGKSATYIRLSDWLGIGDLFSALSGGRTGLLYAIKTRGGEWMVSIGRYVQCSGRILAIDETQEIEASEIKSMAIAMEQGFLSVEKVASGGYNTKVRTIFMLNPKKANGTAATISDFAYGCESLRYCFDPMFIRRLDLAVFTSGKTTDFSFYNKLNTVKQSEMKLTADLMRSLIYWAWTRRKNNIIWGEESTLKCLEKATELSTIYGHYDDAPLANPQDLREKLARVSTAFAILERSFTEDLESVIVLPEHVEKMANFYDIIYSSAACNLRGRSKSARQKKTLDDVDSIKSAFSIAMKSDGVDNDGKPNTYFCQLLLAIESLDFFTKRDLADQLGVSSRWLQVKLTVLRSFNLVENTGRGYVTTKKFNLFMQVWRMDESISNILDSAVANQGAKLISYQGSPQDYSDHKSDPYYSETSDPFSD